MNTPLESFLMRRQVVIRTASLALAVPLALVRRRALANPPSARTLAFEHTHTREAVSLTYAVGGYYLPEALQRLNQFLRDHYTGQIGNIDPSLFDQLHELKTLCGTRRPFHVISGFRCAETNMLLRQRGAGVAPHSLHMEGRAIDIRLPGIALADLRDAALSIKAGGVGFYPAENFVHLDTGRVRYW